MSLERTGSASLLARLRRELTHDRETLIRLVGVARELLDRWPQSPSAGDCALAAVTLHAWYTGLETFLERVLRQIDNEVPRGEQWHQEVVFQATAEVPSVRPAVIDPELTNDLLQLLSFRHFFRHAYGAHLDPGHLHRHLERLTRCADAVHGSIEEFDRFLEQAMRALTT